jgi:hypothetical protein
MYWDVIKVYWKVRMTIIWAQHLNPRMTIKKKWREYLAERKYFCPSPYPL